jgi:hypothetical protein
MSRGSRSTSAPASTPLVPTLASNDVTLRRKPEVQSDEDATFSLVDEANKSFYNKKYEKMRTENKVWQF